MAQPVVKLSPEEWKKVGDFVQSRRNSLGMTQAQAVAAGGRGISLAVWSILENARQERGTMSVAALHAAQRALDLPDEWVGDVLRGFLSGPRPSPFHEAAARWDRLLEQLAELIEHLSSAQLQKLVDFAESLVEANTDAQVEHLLQDARMDGLSEDKAWAALHGEQDTEVGEETVTHPGGADPEPGIDPA